MLYVIIGDTIQDFELIWNGKMTKVDRITLPFQKIEEIALARSNIGTLRQFDNVRDESRWRNKLIWGDNKYVIASLVPEFAGKIKLIYIDPPFFTGTNMNITVEIGDQETVKEPSAMEQIAYRNMWKEGPSSFFQYMYNRFVLMKDLLSDDGSIWVRFDYHYAHYIKAILDEIFGYDNFRNEIVVKRGKVQFGLSNKYTVATDSIFFYSKTENYFFQKFARERYESEPKGTNMVLKGERNPRERTFYDEDGKKHILIPPPYMHWKFIQPKIDEMTQKGLITLKKSRKGTAYGVTELVNGERRPTDLVPRYEFDMPKTIDTNWTDIPGYSNKTGYPTENSEQLLERIILSGSKVGDLVADFFGGSGTTAAMAEKLDRRWITCDIGRFSIHTIRKRLLDTPHCRPFEILNMGRYERKYWMDKVYGEAYRDYINFIIKLYGAKSFSNPTIHGVLGKHAVHVGPIDYSVTSNEIEEAVKEAKKLDFDYIDILGWDWEMGIYDNILTEIKKKYDIGLILKWIPREVMDKRAVDAGDIEFYQLALLEAEIKWQGDTAKVVLKDFVLPNPELIPEDVRVKIKKWSDYIDYWSVDWNYDGKMFRNEWQEFRTKNKSELVIESIPHKFERKNKTVAIKVIDIFGNDTTKIENVNAK
jgi:adenine specific DNA methylase Mod